MVKRLVYQRHLNKGSANDRAALVGPIGAFAKGAGRCAGPGGLGFVSRSGGRGFGQPVEQRVAHELESRRGSRPSWPW